MPQANATTAFFVLSFVFTFVLQLPGVLARLGLLPGDADPAGYLPLAMLGIFGPLVAASYLTWKERGRAGLRALFGGLFAFRISPLYMLLALFAPGLLLSAVLWLLRGARPEGAGDFLPDAPRPVGALGVPVAAATCVRGHA